MMPSVEREESRDRELVLKHEPSFSDSGRSSVPMYAPQLVQLRVFLTFLEVYEANLNLGEI